MGTEGGNRRWAARSAVAVALLPWTPFAMGQTSGGALLPGGLRIVGVRVYSPPAPAKSEGQGLGTTATTDHPEPPLVGYSPRVAVTTSDARRNDDFDLSHQMQYGYVGQPLNPPAEEHFVIGVLDSGSVIDLAAGDSAGVLGTTGPWLGENEFPIGGVGDQVDTTITLPLGIFVAGFGAINPDGTLDLDQVVGHTNVAMLVAPPIVCGEVEIRALVGTPMLSFVATVVRRDQMRTVTVGGKTYRSPDVQILPPGDPNIPVYPRSISLQYGGYTISTTAAYWALFDPSTFEYGDPLFPTLLSETQLGPGFGGGFFATIGVLEGEPSPTNLIRNSRVLVDTGAESSVLSRGVASDLNLDLQNPDFEADICGVSSTVQTVPGFYVDYVKINAGGPIEFSNAPFIIYDFPSPDGEPLDGVLGMNLFWNRNIVFAPSLNTSGFVYVSDPLPYGDFDGNGSVDVSDFVFFQACFNGVDTPPAQAGCEDVDWDHDGDVDVLDFSTFQVCFNGPDNPPAPACPTF